MKKSKLTKLLVLALVAVVALGIGMSAMADEAADATVVFNNQTQEFEFNPKVAFVDVHGHTYPDLFGDKMKNLMPGDTVTQKISVYASNLDSNDIVKMTLNVDPRHATDTKTTNDNIPEDELATYYQLANALNLTVKKDGTAIDSNLAGDGVQLASFKKDTKPVELEVSVDVPLELTGENMEGLIGAIGWVFTVEVTEESGGGGTPIPDPVIPSDPFITDHYAYVIGRDDGLVHPEANITRAEVATIFFRMFTDEVRTQFWKQTNPFDDVFSTNWYNNAVSTMYNAGVVTGYPDGSFKPDGSITRAEFAAMLSRFFDTEYEGEDLFSDIDGHWAADLINNAAQNGLIEGYPDGTYHPDNYITRAEAMTGINRILGRAPNKDRLLSNMITWPDNLDTEKWYYAAVQEATNSHDFDMMGDGTEKWTKLLEVRDWAALEKEWSEANSAKNPGNVVKSSSK